MDNLEPKKLALLRILQILQKYSDEQHPLMQSDIAERLSSDYGINIERKAIGRNLSLLKEAGYEIESGRNGSYLNEHLFENEEIRMLIDSVLYSRFINPTQSKDLIERLSSLSNIYFRSHRENVFSVDKRSKTANPSLFYNISRINNAIDKGCCIKYDYNKYGTDGKLAKSSEWIVSPYKLILQNQRYYLMAFSERWKNMTFHRLDHITNMSLLVDTRATDIHTIPEYRNGVDYTRLSLSLPYMYTDAPEPVTFTADIGVIDQIVDWFGDEAKFSECSEDDRKVTVRVTASPMAMKHWAIQYIDHVEVKSPQSLVDAIRESMNKGIEKYMK